MHLNSFYPDDWKYVGSGSANILLSYCGLESRFVGKVMRLRLKDTGVSAKDTFTYLMSKRFDPLRKYMVKADLFEADFESLQKFQRQIYALGFKHLIDINELHFILLQNVYNFPNEEYSQIDLNKYYKFRVHNKEIILEFKPKWLYELPCDHNACRNCIIAQNKKQRLFTCHLKILQGKQGIEAWCSEIQKELDNRNACISISQQLASTMEANYELIESLAKLQDNTDIHKIISSLNSPNDVDENLQFHMAIRDASIMFNLSTSEAFLIDIDKKSPTKWKAWKAQELDALPFYSSSEFECRVKYN